MVWMHFEEIILMEKNALGIWTVSLVSYVPFHWQLWWTNCETTHHADLQNMKQISKKKK